MQTFPTPFEKNNNHTATYEEGIDYYQRLAAAFPQWLKLEEHGSTDSGKPLHLAILSKGGDFTPQQARKAGKIVFWINNAIHPGEPEGVDASMALVRDYLLSPEKLKQLDRMVIVIVPFYNVDGVLNRNSFSRANQNGPESYGFRGNAKNLDLNRDFVKCDSRNAQTFNQLFTAWSPDLFVDNHTSDGADYQYVMTLIATQHNKLQTDLAAYQQQTLLPAVYAKMKARGFETTPYVNFDETPEKGVSGFLDLPRYSTGYAALHNAIGFMPETHMLKPFKDRVAATYALMDVFVQTLYDQRDALVEARKKANAAVQTQATFDLQWKLDPGQKETLQFKGYAAKYKPSEVSGLPRLYYDRQEPYTKTIDYFSTFKPTVSVAKPAAYIIPQAYTEIADRLQWNGAVVTRLAADQEMVVEMYYIKNYKTGPATYEGRRPNQSVEVETRRLKRLFRQGDYVVRVDQPVNRYIVETLEPQGADSFFTWNFFDGVLMQKEGYSDYVFEDVAARLLKDDPILRAALEEKRKSDPAFAKSASEQLDFVYKHSAYYEPSHRMYPVARLMK